MMNPTTRIGQWMTAVVLLSAFTLMADDALWNQAAQSYYYDWNVVGNWLPGTSFPNGAGEFAGVTNDILGVQTIRLRQDITLGTLAIGDGVASGNNFSMTVGNLSGETFALTFDSGTAGVPAEVILSRTGTAVTYMMVPMVLMSDLLVDLTGTDANNYQGITFRELINMNGHNLVFTNGVYTKKQVTIDSTGDMTGGGRIINNSSSVADVTDKKAFAGKLIANGRAYSSNQSTFTFTNGGFTNAVECEVNGFVANSNIGMGGGIHVGSGSGFNDNPGQRLTRNRITLNGGYLTSIGQRSNPGTDNDWQLGLEWVRDEVAVLDFKSGYSYLGMDKGGNTLGTVLDINTLQRSPGASVYLFKVNDPDKNLLAGNAGDFLVGAGGAAGTTTMSVVPWMGIYNGGGFVSPAGFATYDAATGFRALNVATEYSASITAGAEHNVDVDDISLASDVTVNSLRYGSYQSRNINAGRTLSVTSGGVFFEGTKSVLGKSGDSAAGTLNFGSAEGVVSVHATNVGTIGAVVAGSNGFSKIQSGTLTLTGVNTYSGPTHVGGGTLQVGDGTNPSNLGSGDVNVHAGAVLQISCAATIDDDATLTLYNIGPDFYYGSLSLDDGINETVKYLYLGDEAMPAGTYGSSTSAAAVKDDRYFAGTGILTVSSSAGSVKKGTVILLQ